MSDINQDLAARLAERFGADITESTIAHGEVTAAVARDRILEVCKGDMLFSPKNRERMLTQ